MVVENLINGYVNDGLSIEELAKEFKIGKLKIKKVLLDNNIPIKLKGRQRKYFITNKISNTNDMILVCNNCGKKIKDFNNKSGAVTDHMIRCYPDVSIPSSYKRRMVYKSTGSHWYIPWFTQEKAVIIPTLSCPVCAWSSKDLNNISGSLTKHVEKEHISITEFITQYPDYEKYFLKQQNTLSRNNLFKESEDNYIVCKICDEPYKSISNTHLLLHGLTVDEYRNKFGKNSLVSTNLKNEFIRNLNNAEIPLSYRSKAEIEIAEFIESLGINLKIGDKKQLNGIELDIFLPDNKIAIEYNGLYWHSEKRGKTKHYHNDKTKKCLDKGIRLIHIFSDEWLTKKEIIKNRIKNLLNKNDKKIYARKCEIIIPNKEEKKIYLNENHLQGNDKSSIFYGLKYENKIVAIISFGALRNVMGNKNKNKNEYELYRYASNNVTGGFSKLLNHFLKTINPNRIITYADRNWSPSNDFCFYGDKGFRFIGETKPNYSYTKRYDVREHRFNYRKDKLVTLGYDKTKSESTIMFELGYDRVWDTGNLKYELNKKGAE